jgi:hypothetical protein
VETYLARSLSEKDDFDSWATATTMIAMYADDSW